MLASLLADAEVVTMDYSNFILAGYMISSIFFIMTLSGLSNQESAKTGNWYGVIGMCFGVVLATTDAYNLCLIRDTSFIKVLGVIVIMIIPGACIGTYVALRVVMTSMPELIAMLHSFVGVAATLIGIASYFNDETFPNAFALGFHRAEMFLGVFIGAVTFTGSLIAYGKLSAKISSKPFILGGKGSLRHYANGSIIGVCLILCGMFMFGFGFYADLVNLLVNATLAMIIGVHLIMAIGGADMPVVVSMLNSYSGWATSAAGLMLNNVVMIVTGALVGSSGAILSYIMCRAMNRSFISVILGGFGEGVGAAPAQAIEGEMKEINPDDAAKVVSQSKTIVIVPGYGMAAGKAQHSVAAMTKLLRAHGCNLRFAVHPVAGRLPGHMNVLLAEAHVPYDIVLEMDEINPDLPKTDLCIVLGANDIVNPSAQDDPNSPIAGMPVIECWKAKQTIIIKRGKGAGYAGVENPLFFKANSRMLYGNALTVCDRLLGDLNKIFGTTGAEVKAVETEKVVVKEEKPTYQQVVNYPEPLRWVGVPKEVTEGEKRVAATPESVVWLRKMAFGVYIETGAGQESKFDDEDYVKSGAIIVSTPQELYEKVEIVLKIRAPTLHPVYKVHECTMMKKGQVLLSYLYPAQDPKTIEEIQRAKLTAISMNMIPRISRAQKCDVLSSMAGITGYRAVIEGANYFPRYMTGQITAAGKVPPAKVLIIGCGVAGLASIGAAKGLGAIVRAFDTRSACRDQIESMGGEFLTVSIEEEGETAGGYSKQMSDLFLQKELDLFAAQAKEVDIIIATALIPNRKAPVLLTENIVRLMRRGSVIVDLAAEQGGNCELTHQGETIETENGVIIVGETDFPSKMAAQASTMFSNNLCHMLDEMGKGTNFQVDEKNEIIYGSLTVAEGELKWDPNRKPVSVTAAKPAEGAKPTAAKPAAPTAATKQTESLKAPEATPKKSSKGYFFYMKWGLFYGAIFLILVLAFQMTREMMVEIVIFIFAIFIGYMVIWNVTHALHTPLMSVTNAVSGIIICGGIVEVTAQWGGVCFFLGAISIFFASINIFGGFIVTHRMLQMFVLEKNQ